MHAAWSNWAAYLLNWLTYWLPREFHIFWHRSIQVFAQYYIHEHFSDNVVQVIHIPKNLLVDEIYLIWYRLIILKNLATWVIDDHRGS